MKNYRVVNLELTLPAVRDMPERITREVRQARAHQIRVIKFIHGYGSTGRGGKLRLAVRQTLTPAVSPVKNCPSSTQTPSVPCACAMNCAVTPILTGTTTV